jgi:hypothetical protein
MAKVSCFRVAATSGIRPGFWLDRFVKILQLLKQDKLHALIVISAMDLITSAKKLRHMRAF